MNNKDEPKSNINGNDKTHARSVALNFITQTLIRRLSKMVDMKQICMDLINL